MPKVGGSWLTAALPDLLAPLSGPTTATIYRLLPSTLLPIEPLADIFPAITPNRQTLDVVTNSTRSRNYRVTQVAIQDGTTATINVHRELETLSLSGVISAAPILAVADALGVTQTLVAAASSKAANAIAVGSRIPGFPPPRRDLLQLQMLQLLADRKEIVMVVTPDGAMPRAFIQSITKTNGSGIGDATEVAIDFIEARVVAPQFTDAVLDMSEMLGGTDSQVDAGGQPGTEIATPPPLAGGATG